MSLIKCIKTAAKGISKEDAQALESYRDEFKKEGLSNEVADMRALQKYQQDLVTEESTTRESIENAGGVFNEPLAQSAIPNTKFGGYDALQTKDGFVTILGPVEAIREKIPSGLRGTPVTGGLRFSPNVSHRIEAALEGRERTYSRAGKIYDPVIKDRKYVGASNANNTPAKRKSWQAQFKKLALEGEAGRYWYENSGAAILEMVGGNIKEAKKFITLLAIYSSQAKVDANSTFALRAWAQYKAGVPISVKTRTQDSSATDVLYKDKPWDGEKTNNFYINLLREVDPTVKDKQGATIDMWMMRAGVHDHDAPTINEYRFLENEANILAEELGWEPQQVQAAVWVAMKARMENKTVASATEEVSNKKGWIVGKGVKRKIKNQKKHMLNWIQHAMDYNPSAKDINQAKFDFSDGVRRHMGQVSWEAVPSVTSNFLPGIHEAPPEQIIEYHNAIKDALSNEDGSDAIAAQIGLLEDGSLTLPGWWEGVTSPSEQVNIGMAPAAGGVLFINEDGQQITKRLYDSLPAEEQTQYTKEVALDQAQTRALDVYAAALGLVLRQDGVGYHKPYFNGSKKGSNGVNIELGRDISNSEVKALGDKLDAKYGPNYGIISTHDGVRVVNFGAESDNNVFHTAVEAAAEGSFEGELNVGYFASLGNLVTNDWEGSQNGQDYKQKIITEGPPDLLEWIGDVLQPKVEAVNQSFAQRYGWGEVQPQSLTEKVRALAQSAYHGTPHKFDKFSLEAIGTGEGAQAYGWGLYFSAKREIAEWYRDKLSQRKFTYKGNQLTQYSDDFNFAVQHLGISRERGYALHDNFETTLNGVLTRLYRENARSEADIKVFKENASQKNDVKKQNIAKEIENEIVERNEAIAMLRDIKEEDIAYSKQGNLYQMDIPSDDVLLDWDKPLSEQSAKVRRALYAVMEPPTPVPVSDGSFRVGSYRRKTAEEANAKYESEYDNFTGQEIYHNLIYESEVAGNAQEASEYLNSIGIPGLRYLDGSSRTPPRRKSLLTFEHWLDWKHPSENIIDISGTGIEKVYDSEYKQYVNEMVEQRRKDDEAWYKENPSTYNYVIWDEDTITIEAVNDELRQAEALQQGNRGEYDQETQTIGLFADKSDPTTMIHEQAHFFLDMEQRFAAKYGLTEDNRTMLDWLGLNAFEELDIRTPKGRAAHEKFARGFEAYTMEGKAPSEGLRKVFQDFQQWMINFYKTITALDVELSDEMREVYDRILATDQEIEQATRNEGWQALFDSQPQGMSKTQFAKYKSDIERSKGNAKETLSTSLIKEYRRIYSKQWRDEAKQIEQDYEDTKLGEPAYEALKRLKKDKIDYEAMKEILGHQSRQVIFKKGGKDPQLWVEENDDLGYRTADAMLQDVDRASTRKEIKGEAKAYADATLKERHGDILNDGTIERKAHEALSNEAHARAILAEMKALRTNPNQALPNAEAMKIMAQKTIGEMAYSELRPDIYRKNEIKAAKAAAVAESKDLKAEAYHQKSLQMTNHYLHIEASKIKQKADNSWRKHIQAVAHRTYSPRAVDTDYITNMQTLARSLDARKNTNPRKEFEAMAAWYDGQMEASGDRAMNLATLNIHSELLVNVIAAKKGTLLDQQGNRVKPEDVLIPTWKDISINDLKGVYDTLKHMRRIGGMISDQARAEVQAESQSLANYISEHVHKRKKYKSDGDPTPSERRGDLRDDFKYSLTNLRNQVRVLDGFNEDGMARTLIWDKIVAANNNYMAMNQKIIGDFYTEMKDMAKIGINQRSPKEFTLTNGEKRLYTESDIFMLATYYGTEGSREAVRKGNKLNEADAMMLIESLSPEQLELVNKVWKINESLSKDFFAHISKVDGVAPEKLPPAPYVVNGVQMTGGHMQLYYRGARAELITEQGKMHRQSLTDSRAGSAYNRILIPEHLASPVSFNKHNIMRSLEEKIKDMAYRETAIEINRTLGSPEVSRMIQENHGKDFYMNLFRTIQGVVNPLPAQETSTSIAKLSRHLRAAATARHLMYSIRNTVQQFSAIPIAMQQVGPANFINAAASALSGKYNMPFQMSEFMRNRAKYVNREATEFLKQTMASNRVEAAWGDFKRYGFVLQTSVDTAVAVPTWIAQYEKGMLEHGDQTKAVSDADLAVSESVGSGSDLHLGRLMQSNANELIKYVGMFGSWFNMYYNKAFRDTKGFTTIANWQAIQTVIITPAIVAVMAEALVGNMPDDDQDEIDWVLSSYLRFGGATVPIVKDVVSLFEGFTPSTPWGGAAKDIKWAVNDVWDAFNGNESAWKAIRSTFKATSAIQIIPAAGQVARILDGLADDAQDKSDIWDMFEVFVEGREKDKK